VPRRSRYKDLPPWGEFVQVFGTIHFFNTCEHPINGTTHQDRYFRRMSRREVGRFGGELKGRLIGAKHRIEGEIIHDGDYGRGFQPMRRIFVARIAVSWTKIVEALPEDILPAIPHELPYNGAAWCDHARKTQRELMKGVPRDAKGRWLPE